MAPRKWLENAEVAILFAVPFAAVLETAASEDCEFTLNTTGNVISQDYPGRYLNSYRCSWKLEVPERHVIILAFRSFEMRKDVSCEGDYVALYDGWNATNEALLRKMCGKQIPSPIMSNTNKMIMEYRSNYANLYRGFSASFRPICGSILKTEGNVESPNYPGNYPEWTRCWWKFEVAEGYIIRVVFHSFELEESLTCGNDFVALYDGWNATMEALLINDDLLAKSAPLLIRLCGKQIPYPVISNTNKMIMKFRSDSYRTYGGFSASFSPKLDLKPHMGIGAKRHLNEYFLKTRQRGTISTNKWGTDIARAAVSLFLQDPQFFAPFNETGTEIAYELTLQLMSKLIKKKRIVTKDLALFLNAMTVSCINPRQFFGVDIVGELHKRITNRNPINPFVILSLCNSGENITEEEVDKLQQLFDAHIDIPWTDTQAMIVMALECIARTRGRSLNNSISMMVSELAKKQNGNGGIGDSVKDTALVVQALMATESYQTDFNLTKAIEFISQGIYSQNTEAIYYTVPIIHYKTLLDISSNHCAIAILTDLEDLNYSKNLSGLIEVQISFIIGNDMDFSKTWRCKVYSHYTRNDALRECSASEPDFSVYVRYAKGKHYVARVGNFEYSVEDGLSWFIYTKPLSSASDPTLVNDSLTDVKVTESEYILWYRSRNARSWIKTSNGGVTTGYYGNSALDDGSGEGSADGDL